MVIFRRVGGWHKFMIKKFKMHNLLKQRWESKSAIVTAILICMPIINRAMDSSSVYVPAGVLVFFQLKHMAVCLTCFS